MRIAVWHEALLLQITGDFGERSEWDEVDDLKLVRCPRSLDPTLVTLPSMLLLPSAPFGSDAPKSFAFALSASQLFSQRLNSSTTQRLNILCQLVSVSHFQKCRDLSLPLFLLLLRLARNCGTKSFENLQGY